MNRSLPFELSCIILKQIKSVKVLAECRLVCKKWNFLAEKAMLDRELDLTSPGATNKLIELLRQRPAMAWHIKAMRLSDSCGDDLQSQKQLLSLALTPNIRYLRGEMSKELFGHLLDIAQQSPIKFSKLEALPKLSRKENIALPLAMSKYSESLLYFKDSLKELNPSVVEDEFPATLGPTFANLDEFKSLTKMTLDFTGSFNYIIQNLYFIDLERALNSCNYNHFLQILELNFVMWYPFHAVQLAEFVEWLFESVVPVLDYHNTIRINSVFGPHILEYIAYKYPNVSKLVIYNWNVKDAERAINAIKHINTIQIISKHADIEEMGKDNDDMWNARPSLEIIKSKNKGTTTFNINTQRCLQKYKEIISIVGSESQSLEFNYLDHYPSSENEDSLLDKPQIETSLHVLDKLTTLKVQCDGEEINESICKEIAHSAPNLKHLTLTTCCSYLKGHCLSFPETELESISICTGPDSRNKYLQNDNQSLLLTLEKTQDDSQESFYYYLLTPATSSTPSHGQQIAKESLSECHHEMPSIRIVVKSLNNLKINLDALDFEMEFNS
ncbi:hypothetical protein [Parasitella parasitica]|uniref:F-box domain-containing protein n=1 Tax=Parasitella parasitica TaxID=35722 RepID=A0A0B7N767_9FUNG|nr:hypothetical protein [Parasitella parasitica]